MSYEDMRNSPKSTAAFAIETPGKIYIKDNYLFVNEKYKGIHVYDNSNPAQPVNLTFINIPGNVDMAIRGNFLYADNYVDLVVLDITNITAPVEVARITGIFPYTIPETELAYPISNIDQNKGVIVGWKQQEITEEVENYNTREKYYFDGMGNMLLGSANTGGSGVRTVGVGGSLARFIINGEQFYGLNQTDMQVINISQPYRPQVGSKIQMSRAVETVFIEGNYLFVGTQTGMLIYDITEASFPVYKSEYNHVQSCDPVVVQNNLAYVTLRAGNFCGNLQSQMEVIDIQNINNPTLLKSYPMTEPYGLGIDNNTLFVCDGPAGLKIYNTADPMSLESNILKQYTNLNAKDVIPLGNLLIMVADDGIYQYDYSDPQNITQLSKIDF
jgi:hypothetical protein